MWDTLYFEARAIHLQKVPSLFVWNADETRVGKPTKQEDPDVTVSAITKTGTVMMAEECDNSQLTVPTDISAFPGLKSPLIHYEKKTFEWNLLEREQLYHGHDYFDRNVEKTFIPKALFMTANPIHPEKRRIVSQNEMERANLSLS
jgi:hypothetical protein